MFLNRGRENAVSAVAGILALCSLFLPFLILRPSRISSGAPVMWWRIVPPTVLVGGAAVFFFFLFLPFIVRRGPRPAVIQGLLGNILGFLVFFAGGTAAARLAAQAGEFARVSLAGGSWLMLLAAYILIVSAIKNLPAQKSVSAPKHPPAGESLPARRIWTLAFAGGALAGITVLALAGQLDNLSLLREFYGRQDRFWRELWNHLGLAGGAVGAAVILGVPLGMLAFRVKPLRKIILPVVNLVQTIPSLALFGLLIAPLALLSREVPFLRQLGVQGIGWAPAVLALTVYALLPITRNTYEGLGLIDPSLREAGRGTGFGAVQLLIHVELPLALPVILAGVRISFVQAIGNTTVAALIGAGGFGVFVFQGFGQAVPDLILLGALPVIVLAVTADRLLGFLIGLIVPRGLRLGEEAA
jgi:osmoprotectant transport system permease protein